MSMVSSGSAPSGVASRSSTTSSVSGARREPQAVLSPTLARSRRITTTVSRTPSTFIAYGAHIEGSTDSSILTQYELEPGGYFFVASRLEPENNADTTVRAFEHVATDKKLVIAGGANWESPFVEELKRTSDPRVKLLGPVYEPGHIQELHAHCYAYVHGNEVGGTNPALLKALGYGNCVIALDVPFNAEVVADAAVVYRKDPQDLAAKMQQLIDQPELAAEYRRRAPERIAEAYDWASSSANTRCSSSDSPPATTTPDQRATEQRGRSLGNRRSGLHRRAPRARAARARGPSRSVRRSQRRIR